MKLIGYELYKGCANRLLPLLILIALAANGWIFCQEAAKPGEGQVLRDNRAVYDRLLAQYQAMPPDEASRELRARLEEVDACLTLQSLDQMDGASAQTEAARIEQRFPGLAARYQSGEERLTDSWDTDYSLLAILSGQADYVSGYAGYVSGVRQRADGLLGASVFSKPSTFSYRNIEATVRDYQGLEALPVKLDVDIGVVTSTRFPATDIFLVLLAVMTAVSMTAREKESGLYPLLKSAKLGRSGVIRAKLAAAAMAVLLITLLLQGENLLLAVRLWGLGDLSRPLQSIPAFRGCTEALSIGAYLGLAALVKFAAALLICWLAMLLTLTCSHTPLALLVLAAVLGGEWSLWRYVPALSPANHLKYLNLFGFSDSYALFSQYQNLNLFGFPVSVRLLAAALLPALLAALGAACAAAYLSRGQSRRGSGRLSGIRRKLAGWTCAGGLWRQEGYRLLLGQRVLLILLALALLQWYSVANTFATRTQQQTYYERYIDRVSALSLADAAEYLDAEQAVVDSQAAAPGQMMIQPNQDRMEALSWVQAQRVYLEELQAQGIEGRYVDLRGYSRLFALNGSFNDLTQILILAVLAAVCLGPTLTRERATGGRLLLLSTMNGRSRAIWIKLIWGALAVGVIAAMVWGGQLLGYARVYLFKDWPAPVQSIMRIDQDGVTAAAAFQRFPFPLTIGQYTVLLYLFRLVMAWMASGLILLISSWLRSAPATVLISAAVVALPPLLCAAGMGGATFSAIASWLSGNQCLQRCPAAAIAAIPAGMLLWWGEGKLAVKIFTTRG